MNSTQALELMIPFFDEVYLRYSSIADEKRKLLETEKTKIKCGMGCGACCHFPLIPATGGEAFVLLHQLLASGETIEALHTKFFGYSQKYFAWAHRNNGLPFTDSQQRSYFKEKLPCPLFVADGGGGYGGKCGVFNVRPLICDYYHSLDSKTLCEEKREHRSFLSLIDVGEDAVETLRIFERGSFGRSALGHLPLLLAALCTSEGMNAFLAVRDPETDPENQAEKDFEFYGELLTAAGYDLTVNDLHSLIEAQNETLSRN